MPTVAEQLRQAREAQNLDIYQVAEITKIRTDHIRALEAGQFDVFIAPVYIRGFVRTYAKALKLDVEQVVSDLAAELSKTEKFRDPPPLSKEPRSALDVIMLQLSRLNWRILAGVIVVLVVLVITFVSVRKRHKSAEDPLKGLPPGIYQPKDGQKGEKLPLPNTPPRRQ
jgi:cytoskeletal protein RodZ